MSEHKNNEILRSKGYFRYLIFILILANIVDSYVTIVNGMFPSKIAEEFLSGYSTNEQNALMAIGASIASMGYYFIFVNLYLADKIGRKKVLAYTIIGIALSCLMMILSTNFWQYVFFWALLYLFFSSDLWAIYINEESIKEKRAFYQYIILIGGLIGPVLAIILRSIFITETRSDWRVLLIIPILIGIPLSIIVLFTLKETSIFQLMKKDLSLIEKRSFREDLKAIFRTDQRKAYISLLIITLVFGAATIWRNLFEKYITDVGILTQTQISIVFIWTVLAVLIAFLINGLLADRIGRKPLVYLWSCLLPVGVMIWVVGAHDPQNAFIIVQIGFALMHVCFWGLLTILSLITIETLPTDRRASGVGLRWLFFAIGTTLGLLLSSIVILFLGLGIAFIIFILTMYIIAPLTYLSLKETKGIELSEIK
ncbi:MAG: MFS transporter [Promethearchaeota archaeon]